MAETNELDVAWQRNREAQKGQNRFYIGLALGIAVLFGVWLGGHLFGDDLAVNMWTEGISIAITVGLLGLINGWQAEKRYKNQLVDEASSDSNEIAKHAIHIMRRRGWLEGENGILKNIFLQGVNLKDFNLSNANLQNSDLSGANLENVKMSNANLRDSKMICTKLQNAFLVEVDFQYAIMPGAKLENAELWKSNFQDARLSAASLKNSDLFFVNLRRADLTMADLTGTQMAYVNLQGAILFGAIFNTSTMLPDGSKWSSSTNMKRFTDPNHPDFWRSDNLDSPAYKKPDK